jgi:hypothetical protein
MASSYTGLGIELMVTGENAGTWGTKTNTNLQLISQISGGYTTQAVNGTGATTLAVVDGGTGAALATRVIKLTGTITGNITVTIPLDVENFYFIENATTGAYTVEFKYVSGSGSSVTWSATDKTSKIVNATADDGTNPNIKEITVGGLPGGSTTQVQYNNSGAFGGDANFIWNSSTGLNIGSQKELRLQDTTGGEYIGQKAAGTTTSYTLTWPAGVAAANDYVLTSQTDGTLAWVENTGGTKWQAVSAAAAISVTAGNGYFLNTTGNAITATLPASPSLGDEIAFADYAGTFDSYNLTVARNGKKIQGATADLTVATERAAFTLVFSDDTQGWLLKNK